MVTHKDRRLKPAINRLSDFEDSVYRKVWVVVPPRPWQGKPAARFPLHPFRRWLFQGIEPLQNQQTVSPVKHSRETSLSLHPSTWRAFLPPRPQTTPWRRLHREQRAFLPLCNPDQEGSCRATLPRNHPIDQGCFTPLEPRPTQRGLDAAILSKLDHVQGTFRGPLASRPAWCGYPPDFVCL